jgi:hypothetical protein
MSMGLSPSIGLETLFIFLFSLVYNIVYDVVLMLTCVQNFNGFEMLSNYKDVFGMEGDIEMCNKHLEFQKSFQLHPILLM